MSQTTNNNESNEENTNVVSNPSTTTTRKRKRNNSNNNVESSEPLTKKKSTKKLTKSESTLIANAYKYHNGNYAKIYKDPNIVKLKKTNQQIYNHIQYLKNKKNRTISTGRSDEAREDILDAIVESNPEGVDGMEQTLSSYVASDHESDDESEYETPLTPELPNNLQAIHDQDRSDLDDSVNSENISSASDFTTHSQKITDRQKIRTAKIRQKEKERNTILDDIRQQQQERKEATDFKQMMMFSIMQQQQMFQALLMKLFAIPLPNNPDSNVFNLFANNVNNSNTEQNSNNNTTQQL